MKGRGASERKPQTLDSPGQPPADAGCDARLQRGALKWIDCPCDGSSEITAFFLIKHCAAALYKGVIVSSSFITVSS